MGVMETYTQSSEDAALIGERQAAARTLLKHPLLTARAHPAGFALVRSHAEWLVQRFQRVLGYRLSITEDHARLAKRGLVGQTPRPVSRPTGTGFTPRTHTYLALSLAVLVEDAGPTTVRALADQVRAAAREAGVDADPSRNLAERRAFCAALRLLVSLGAVQETSGTVRDHQTDPAADPGLSPSTRVARAVAVHLPKAAEDPDAFLADAADVDPDGDQAGEVALRRLLAETAVVYREELPERQRDRLAAHQWRAAAALTNLLGCEAEVRAEGVALVMPDEAAAASFPSGDPVGQVALSLVRHLSGRLHPGQPGTSVPVPDRELHSALEALGGAESPLRAEWARTVGPEVPSPERLAERVLALLVELGLLRGGRGQWRLTAAAARYGTDVDDRIPRIQDNGEYSGTLAVETSGSGPEHGSPEPSAAPRDDLGRVAAVLQTVANEKVSATSGDTGDQRDPRGSSG